MDIGSGWEAVLWLFIFLLSLFPLVLGVAAKLTGLVVYKFVLGRMQQQGNGAVVSGTTGKDLLQYVGI